MIRSLLFFGSILVLNSCSNVNFVVKMHNNLTNEFKNNGTSTYTAEEMTNYGGDSVKCQFSNNINRINALVPFDAMSKGSCRYVVNFEYYTRLRKYVKEHNPSQYSKLQIIDEMEFEKIDSYFDSLHLNKIQKNSN